MLVLEDVHWADEATLDVLRVLGRRIEACRRWSSSPTATTPSGRCIRCACCSATSPTAHGLGRVALDPLSPQAVGEMAAGYPLDAAELHRLTGGNPFYVHEVLEAGGEQVPATVGEVVYTRAARMSEDARSVLDSVVGGAAGARAVGARGGLRRGRGARSTSAWPAACWSTTTAGVALPPRAGPAGDRGARSGRPAGEALHAALLAALGDPTRGHRPGPAGPSRRGRGRRRGRAAPGAGRRAPRRRGRRAPRGGGPVRTRPAVRRGASRPPSGPSSRRGWPTRCMQPTTRSSRSPPASARSSISARQAMRPAKGTPCAIWSRSYSCRGMMADARAAADEAMRVLEPLGPSPALGAAYDSLCAARAVRQRFRRGGRVGRARGRVRRRRRCHASQRSDLGGHRAAAARRPGRCRRCSMRGLELACEHGLEQEIAAGPQRLGDRRRRSTGRTRWPTPTSRPASAIAPSTTSTCGRCRLLGAEGALGAQPGPLSTRRRRSRSGLAGELRDSPAPRFEGLLVLATVRARRGDPGVRGGARAGGRDASTRPTTRLGRAAGDRSRRGGLAGRRRGACRRADLACADLALEQDAYIPWMLGELACWRRRAGIGRPDHGRRRRAVGAGARRPPCRGGRGLGSAGLPVRVGHRAGHGRRGDGGGASSAAGAGRRRRGGRLRAASAPDAACAASPAARGRARARTRRT